MNSWNPNWREAHRKVQRVHAQEGLIVTTALMIREMLAAKKMTQAGLAKALGKTEGHVSRLLNDRNLRLSTLSDICRAIGVEVTAKFVATAPALMIVASMIEMPATSAPANTGVYVHRRPTVRLIAHGVPPKSKADTSLADVA